MKINPRILQYFYVFIKKSTENVAVRFLPTNIFLGWNIADFVEELLLFAPKIKKI